MSEPGQEPKAYEIRAVRWAPGAKQAVLLSEDECGRAPTAEQPGDALTWVHITAKNIPATAELLQSRFGFHPLEVEDALSNRERPHLHENSDHLFLAAPAVWMEGQKVVYSEVGFFVARSQLVSVSVQALPLLDEWFARWQERGPDVGRHVGFLLHSLVDGIVDSYYPVLDALEDQGDALESAVFKGKPVQVKELLRLKRRLLEVRRRLSPFRDILNGLLRRDLTMVSAESKPYFQDVYDHVLRILETVDVFRDILASVLDAHLANVSNRLNDVMRLLTVIATVLMTLGLVAGWYGMNFKHMPELDWPWAYPALIGVMIGIAGLEVYFFKRKGWL
ncbi:MAG: magnesium and cobalt transport protein CorA [Gammaproteobacteria bacterium RBG_16_66_13]|nr:MAG: magnesium and cobalt transport protein CorA [Gammaproteobacteria bacterium RBG_16_66_13]